MNHVAFPSNLLEMRFMRLKLTVLLLAVLQRTAPAQASVQHPPSTASSRRSAVGGGLSLINGKTLVDTRVSDTSGWCHISLVQPLFSGIILLHMTLNGRGSRVVGAPRTPITAPTLLAACALARTLCTVRTARGQQHHPVRTRAQCVRLSTPSRWR